MLNKKISLPQLEAVIGCTVYQPVTLVAVAGGRVPDKGWLGELAADKELFCADRGIEACFSAELVPQALWGDCDSTSAELYERARQLGTRVYSYSREKDDTDLQLLLKELPEGDLICSGIWGGRFDHLYSNVFSLLQYKLQRQNQVLMADSMEVMFLLQAGEEAELSFRRKPYALSLLPLNHKVSVDFTGVYWPLKGAELKMLYPYAISNEAVTDKISCKCLSGCLGLYCLFQQA